MPDPIERLRALVDQAKPGAHPDTYDGRMALASAQRRRDAAAVALLPHFLELWNEMRVHIYKLEDMRDVAARKTYAEIGHYVATVLPGLAGVLHDLDEAAQKEVGDA